MAGVDVDDDTQSFIFDIEHNAKKILKTYNKRVLLEVARAKVDALKVPANHSTPLHHAQQVSCIDLLCTTTTTTHSRRASPRMRGQRQAVRLGRLGLVAQPQGALMHGAAQ